MKVVVCKKNGCVLVTKEKGDPLFRWSGWSDPESKFLYRVQQELEKQGYDCIKKRMWRDGHLVDDSLQYIRSRTGTWYIYNDRWAVNDAGQYFNEYGEYELAFVE